MPFKYSVDKTKGILDAVRPHFPKDGERKAAIEVVKVIDTHLAEVRITEVTDAKKPVAVGDWLFNPAWEPNLKVHVAVAGVIPFKDGGADRGADFRKDLAKYGVAVDAFLDLKTRKVTGEMSLKTEYLVLGDAPEMPGDETREILKAMATLQEEGGRLGVTIVPYRRFIKMIGYQPKQPDGKVSD